MNEEMINVRSIVWYESLAINIDTLHSILHRRITQKLVTLSIFSVVLYFVLLHFAIIHTNRYIRIRNVNGSGKCNQFPRIISYCRKASSSFSLPSDGHSFYLLIASTTRMVYSDLQTFLDFISIQLMIACVVNM